MLVNGEIIKTLIELLPFSANRHETSVYAKNDNKIFTIDKIELNEDKEIIINILER